MRKAEFLKKMPEAGQKIAVRHMASRGDSPQYDHILFFRLMSTELYAKSNGYHWGMPSARIGGLEFPNLAPNDANGKPPKKRQAIFLALKKMTYVGAGHDDFDFDFDGTEDPADFKAKRGPFNHGFALSLNEIRDFAIVGEHQGLVESLFADREEVRKRKEQRQRESRDDAFRQEEAAQVLSEFGIRSYGAYYKPADILDIAQKYHQAQIEGTD